MDEDNIKEFLASLSALTRKHKIEIIGTYDGAELIGLSEAMLNSGSKYINLSGGGSDILHWSYYGN